MVSEVRRHLEDARLLLLQRQETQKKYADQHRREERYAVGDEVMLSTEQLPAKFRAKLSDPYTGPFRVVAVKGDVNVELELPPSLKRIHPVFHVDRLKRYVRSTVEWPGREQQDRPPPVLVEGDEEWEVERIVGKREWTVPAETGLARPGADDDSKEAEGAVRRSARLRATAARRAPRQQRRKVIQYLVKWKGFDDDDDTWVKEEDLEHAREAVDDYEHQQRLERGEEAVAVMVVTACGD
jgi:hypothetical protein